MTTSTLMIAFDISVYFGEVLINNNRSVYWGFLRKPKKLNGVNRPILLGFTGDLSVFPYTLVDVAIRICSCSPNDKQLYELYENWKKCLIMLKVIVSK